MLVIIARVCFPEHDSDSRVGFGLNATSESRHSLVISESASTHVPLCACALPSNCPLSWYQMPLLSYLCQTCLGMRQESKISYSYTTGSVCLCICSTTVVLTRYCNDCGEWIKRGGQSRVSAEESCLLYVLVAVLNRVGLLVRVSVDLPSASVSAPHNEGWHYATLDMASTEVSGTPSKQMSGATKL
jgi:hypothetical protein